MRPDETIIAEMSPLLEALCEDRLAPDEALRLEQLVLRSDEARWFYLTYLDLHGSLYWNAGGVGSAEALSSEEIPVAAQGFAQPVTNQVAAIVAPAAPLKSKLSRRVAAAWTLASCAALALLIGWWGRHPDPDQPEIVHVEPSPPSVPQDNGDKQNQIPSPVRRHVGPPVELANHQKPVETPGKLPAAANPVVPAPPEPPHEDLNSLAVVAAINSQLKDGWKSAEIQPSALADDAEWLRRVFLDLLGRIPTVGEVEPFLASKRPDKRIELVDKLLDDTEFAGNLTTVWTNLLIGRRSEQQVNRTALQKFLRMSFASNRPWNQVVYDLVAAEGNNVENGATNFLIAHLNNDALPATAVTARVFLGEQLQCNQCHNNPFDKTQQSAFWELHSFFSQTASVPRQAVDPKSGQTRYSYTELVTNTAGGPIFYETQNGVMRVAFPRFRGEVVDPSPETNRRATLARLMTEGNQPQLAAAYVNRLWEHFFGHGFAPSADNVGPHGGVSHPELLNLMAKQFVRSGYDTKQLIRWICASEPYQLSSRFGADNHDDDPVEGQMPLFSRMYVKPMSPEQMYDSFVVATKAHLAGGVDWEEAETQRQHWLTQFVVDYETDENDEAMKLDGNLVQALTLMNGSMVDKALENSPGTFLGEVVRKRVDEKEKIRELCLAVLSRQPTTVELASMRKLVRRDAADISARGNSRQVAESEGYQDLLWALLNSNEFSVVH